MANLQSSQNCNGHSEQMIGTMVIIAKEKV